jgi:hypothetical protein
MGKEPTQRISTKRTTSLSHFLLTTPLNLVIKYRTMHRELRRSNCRFDGSLIHMESIPGYQRQWPISSPHWLPRKAFTLRVKVAGCLTKSELLSLGILHSSWIAPRDNFVPVMDGAGQETSVLCWWKIRLHCSKGIVSCGNRSDARGWRR